VDAQYDHGQHVVQRRVDRLIDGGVQFVLGCEVGKDGRLLLVSGSWDKSARVWDAASGAPVGQPLVGNEGCVWAVSAAQCPATGHLLLATGSEDRGVVDTGDIDGEIGGGAERAVGN
jgi:WD40 repeat protein